MHPLKLTTAHKNVGAKIRPACEADDLSLTDLSLTDLLLTHRVINKCN